MLVFQNDGLVPIEAFSTFGMSAKPSSNNPIGKFGTGLKYAVAITLRLGGTFKLYRGLEEYVFYTKDTDFRGKTFAKVRMKKRKGSWAPWRYEALPFTTELGKHWKPWMAIRELEANVRDENNPFSGIIESEEGIPVKCRTTIVIECEELEDAYANLGDIFLEERNPIFENDSVRIFEGENQHVFYRGMRVTDLRKPTLFTYEMKHVFLTEDRTSQYAFIDDTRILEALLECDDHSIIDRVVKAPDDYHESTLSWDERGKQKKASRTWYGALSGSGLSSRMSTLRDNLEIGLAPDEELDVSLRVDQWERVMRALETQGESTLAQKVRQELKEAGWRPSTEIDEIAEAAYA